MPSRENFLRFGLTTVFVLAGCAVGPDYKKPHPELPDHFSQTDPQLGIGEDLDVTWWQSFDDEILNQLIVEAASNNRGVRQAVARINESRALANQAVSELLPGARLSGTYEKARNSNSRFPGSGGSTTGPSQGNFEYEVYTGSVDASWEVDLFGRLRRDLEAKNAEYDGTVAELHDVLRILFSDLASHYVSLRGAQHRYAIAQSNEELQKKSLELVQSKFTYGEVPELDVERAKTQLAQTQASIPPLENEVNMRMHRLAVLIGEAPRDLVERLSAAPLPNIPSYAGPVTIGNPQALLRHRPDVRRAERTLAAATAQIGVKTAELFPIITIDGSLGVEAPKFSLLDNGARIFRYGPTITWAAFDTGRLRQQIYAQEAETQAALMAYEQTVLTSLEDVENAFSTFTTGKSSLLHYENAFLSSRKAF